MTQNDQLVFEGLTKREYFAAVSMGSLILKSRLTVHELWENHSGDAVHLTEASVKLADHLITALNQQ